MNLETSTPQSKTEPSRREFHASERTGHCDSRPGTHRGRGRPASQTPKAFRCVRSEKPARWSR